jgi:acetate kinase
MKVANLRGLDALVFTGGIGEHDPLTRHQVCDGLDPFGIVIDPKQNAVTKTDARVISRKESKTDIFVVPAREDRVIALHVVEILKISKNFKNSNLRKKKASH